MCGNWFGSATISGVKAHKRALPIDAATKLADYIGADLRAVIAANELVTEKKEEKKNYWMQFISQAKTAAYMIVALSVTNFMTAPEKAFANNDLQKHNLHFTNYTKYTKYRISNR